MADNPLGPSFVILVMRIQADRVMSFGKPMCIRTNILVLVTCLAVGIPIALALVKAEPRLEPATQTIPVVSVLKETSFEQSDDQFTSDRALLASADDLADRHAIETVAPGIPHNGDRLASEAKHNPHDRLLLALRRVNTISEKEGRDYRVAIDSSLDPLIARDVVAAYDRFMAESSKIDEMRFPIVRRIVDAKRGRGDIESYPLSRAARGEMTVEQRNTLSRDLATKRRPTKPDQTVVTSGLDGRMEIVRVDSNEDLSLLHAYSMLHDAERLYLESVILLVQQPTKR
jgi:hypothetical protein